jgi:hypothetical protein
VTRLEIHTQLRSRRQSRSLLFGPVQITCQGLSRDWWRGPTGQSRPQPVWKRLIPLPRPSCWPCSFTSNSSIRVTLLFSSKSSIAAIDDGVRWVLACSYTTSRSSCVPHKTLAYARFDCGRSRYEHFEAGNAYVFRGGVVKSRTPDRTFSYQLPVNQKYFSPHARELALRVRYGVLRG